MGIINDTRKGLSLVLIITEQIRSLKLIRILEKRINALDFENTVKFRKPLHVLAPQSCNAKNPPLNRPSEYKPRGGLYLEIALKYKVKQSKNGQYPSNYNSSNDFEMPVCFHR